MRDISTFSKLIENIEVEAVVRLPKLSSHNVCNPSVIYINGKFLVVYKGINYDVELSGYKATYAGFHVPFSDSQNYYAELDSNLQLLNVAFIEDRHIRGQAYAWQGIQDVRLFSFNDKLLCMGTAITHQSDLTSNKEIRFERVILCELKGKILMPLAILPSRQRREKNWMPWVVDDNLFSIYAQDPFEVFHIADGKISRSFRPQTKQGLEGQSGGSCVVPWKDKFIAIVHKRYPGNVLAESNTDDIFCYTHTFVVYSPNFDILAVSQPFTFEGQRIEFCAGLACYERSIVFSYGVWDKKAVLLKVTASSFFEAMGLSDLL